MYCANDSLVFPSEPKILTGNAEGVLTRTGKNIWSPTTLSKMIRNPAYKGMAAYGKKYGKKQRKRLRPRKGPPEQPKKNYWGYVTSKDKWIYIAVPPIVSEDIFEMVQKQLIIGKTDDLIITIRGSESAPIED